ncbi:Mating-type-like protein A1 [Nakaseomyces glabratus]|uniref:Mating-type-like protein A1 n=1 Tax=Candida glabrata TaxID=5478 RepID=A0A0W0DQU0_CANGB|nr:Mating-type-like protein A1 [Nakaseomyces glabratus]KTA96864.1 Mating-type-like protein A1 [Nakaseomyces glabratus]KTA97961.1 Mating-type-like protein A1 [Nakaseomyces glabratus]KTB01991.1 Mating-type-like protein A1 [Nakaseomyces glabratus]KTB13303.1 Mating-type-like protein A1 [Nakaseomyces glabratus]
MTVDPIQDLRNICLQILQSVSSNTLLEEETWDYNTISTTNTDNKLINNIDLPKQTREALRRSASQYLLYCQRKNQTYTTRKPLPAKAKLQLVETFSKKRYLTRCEKHQLAVQCGITTNQVQIWFANRRKRSKDLNNRD